jgi:hypothetical protein
VTPKEFAAAQDAGLVDDEEIYIVPDETDGTPRVGVSNVEREQLERMIDRAGMTAFLETVEAICFAKAERAKALWERIGAKIGVVIPLSRDLR